MKFSCTICNRFAAGDLYAVLRHVGSTHSFEPDFQITCGVSNCSRTYKNFRSFRKHVLRMHAHALDASYSSSSTSNMVIPSNVSADSDSDVSNEVDVLPDTDTSHSQDLHKVDLQKSAALFLLKIKEVGRISQAALNTVIEGVTELIQAHEHNSKLQPFRGLETEFLQRKYFENELDLLVCT